MDDIKIGIDRKTYRLKEENLARKRNQEYHKQLFWNDITNYYKTWDAQATKYNTWLSYAQSTSSTVRNEEKQQFSEEKLQQRRLRLQSLLIEEFHQYENELQRTRATNTKISSDCPKWTNLPHNEVNSYQQDRLKEYSCRKIFQSTGANRTADNHLEEKQIQRSVDKCWNEQMKEKQARKEYERKLVLRLEEESARKRLLEEELEKETITKKKEEMKKLQLYLLAQMEEVKKRDALTEQIKLQEQRDIKLKTELEKIVVQRNQAEKQRRSKELSSFQRHQYQLQLKQKTKQIQEQLKEDARFIKEITRCLEEETAASQVREQTRKELDRANALLNDFSRLEIQREKEMEFLFFEEAKKLWHKQEIRWNAEQEARNNLMRDVLVTVQKQIKEKLEKDAQQHAKLIEEKEQFLHHIDAVNAQLKQTNAEMKQKKEKYRKELDEQITEKRLLAEQEKCQYYSNEEKFTQSLQNSTTGS